MDAAVSAVSIDQPGGQQWIIRGWWAVGTGECINAAYFPRPRFFVYAEQLNPRGNRRMTWPGRDTTLCVDYPGPFERVAGGDQCEEERLKGFTRIDVGPEIGTYTITLP